MFSDPLSFVTTGVVTGSSLARTGSSDSSGAFANATDGLTLRVSHRYTKGRAQRLFRIDKQVLEANPLVSAQNQAQTASVWVARRSAHWYYVNAYADVYQGPGRRNVRLADCKHERQSGQVHER